MAATITFSMVVEPYFDVTTYEENAKDSEQMQETLERLRTPFSIRNVSLEESRHIGEIEVALPQALVENGGVLQQKVGFMGNAEYTAVLREWVKKLKSARPLPLSAEHPTASRLEISAKNCSAKRYYIFHTDIPRLSSSSSSSAAAVWTTSKVLYLIGVIAEDQQLVVPLSYYHIQHLVAIREELVDEFLQNDESKSQNFHFYTTKGAVHRSENALAIAPFMIGGTPTATTTTTTYPHYSHSAVTDYMLARHQIGGEVTPTYGFYINATNWNVIKEDRSAHFERLAADGSDSTCTFVLDTQIRPFKASSLGYEYSRTHGKAIKRQWTLKRTKKVKITGRRNKFGWFKVTAATPHSPAAK